VLLNDVCVLSVQLTSPVHSHNDLFTSVVDALSEIAPAERYLRTDVTLPSGHVIGDVTLSALLI